MAVLAIPHFRYPDGVSIRWVLSNHIAKAARHAVGAFQQNGNQRIALSGPRSRAQ